VWEYDYPFLVDESNSHTLAMSSETESADDGIVREIGHDEFDPVGTLALIFIYFVIIAGLWAFMYFVEFLGNGPTVV
jgi:hypothetical protein